jgi:hypothetical protein
MVLMFRYEKSTETIFAHHFSPPRILFAIITNRPRPPRPDTMAVHAWCSEKFGAEQPVREGFTPRWIELADMFMFRDEADAFEFRIRWC